MNRQYTDEEIIEGVRKRDANILQYWYKRDFSYIKGYILKNKGTEDDVKEIYQDAFMVCYQKVREDTFELKSALKTFLYGIVKRLWWNKLKEHKKQEITEDIQGLKIAVVGSEYDREIDEREEEVIKKLNDLGEGCQKILKLYYFYDKSMKEIAQALGYKDEKNARNAKYKCMQKLKKSFN